MNQTAMLMYMVPVVAGREWITPGLKAGCGRAPDNTAQQAALARAVAGNEAFPAVNALEVGYDERRRAELIRKHLDEGLTPTEGMEYERLQRLSLAAVVESFPRGRSRASRNWPGCTRSWTPLR